MKKVTVTFDYDPEKDSVVNVKCSVDGVEQKKKTTKKAKDVKDENPNATVKREDNKLVLSPKAVELLDATPEDRISVRYEKIDNVHTALIAKEEYFGQEGNGNKLSKSNTVPMRGKANTVLSEFGTDFILYPHKEGVYKMIDSSVTVPSSGKVQVPELKEVELSEIDLDIVVDSTDEYEIDQFDFKID